MINAKEAKRRTDEFLKAHNENVCVNIERVINKAIEQGLHYIYVYPIGDENTKKYLESLGYKVTLEPTGYNETCTKISWE
jgi:hypothetical protein